MAINRANFPNIFGARAVPDARALYMMSSAGVGSPGTAIVNSDTTLIFLPTEWGRKYLITNLSMVGSIAAGSTGAVTLKVIRHTGSSNIDITDAISIKSDVITGNVNVQIPIKSTLLNAKSLANLILLGSDTLRAEVVAADTISTQPNLVLVAELSLIS